MHVWSAERRKASTAPELCPRLPRNSLIKPQPSLIREQASASPTVGSFKVRTCGRLRASLPVLGAIASLAGFTACRTPARLDPVNVSQPGWQLRQGQALWKSHRAGPEIAGELLVATHPEGRSLVQFTKTPLPLLAAQVERDRWQIEFVPEKRSVRGQGPPPAHFIWLHLAAALASKVLPKELSVTRHADGGWILKNSSTGETISGFVVP